MLMRFNYTKSKGGKKRGPIWISEITDAPGPEKVKVDFSKLIGIFCEYTGITINGITQGETGGSFQKQVKTSSGGGDGAGDYLEFTPADPGYSGTLKLQVRAQAGNNYWSEMIASDYSGPIQDKAGTTLWYTDGGGNRGTYFNYCPDMSVFNTDTIVSYKTPAYSGTVTVSIIDNFFVDFVGPVTLEHYSGPTSYDVCYCREWHLLTDDSREIILHNCCITNYSAIA